MVRRGFNQAGDVLLCLSGQELQGHITHHGMTGAAKAIAIATQG